MAQLGSWTVPAGIVVFPITYVIGDVLTEVFGYRAARRVILLGFVCNAIAVLAIWAAQLLPPAPVWDGQAAYERILGSGPRVLSASFSAYLVGEISNSYVLSWMKKVTRGRWLWTRTIGSTVVGQGLDSLIFVMIAFLGSASFVTLLGIAAVQWVVKTLYEAVLTPVTYVAVGFFASREREDRHGLTRT